VGGNVGRYGCQNDGLDEPDTIVWRRGREGGREGGRERGRTYRFVVGVEALAGCLHVVVCAAACLAALEEAL